MKAVTIGNFDGVHKGHKALLARVKRNQAPTVVTFFPHPSAIVKPTATPLLTTLPQKLALLKEENVDVLTLDFTKTLSELSAESFLTFLKEKTAFECLVLGSGARMGHKREAGLTEIASLCKKLHFEMEAVDPLVEDGLPISSSRIRSLIAAGHLQEAAALLGRPYRIAGQVQKGAGLGRVLGFRTLNLPLTGLVTPPFGVYFVHALIQGVTYRGVANIGVSPTVKPLSLPLLEVHLLECEADFYDQEVQITFLRFLREEKHFSSFSSLQTQIDTDVREAQAFFHSTLTP